jgi:predicted phage terminase large subunit-like protein
MDKYKKLLENIEVFHNFILPILAPTLTEKKNYNVPKFHFDIYKNLLKQERCQLLVAPVAFSKSTLLKIFALYQIFIKEKTKYILYVSSTDKKAIDQLGGIIKILKTPYVKETFNYKILSANKHEIIINYNNITYKIEAVASGSEISGKNYEGTRPGLIIVDDLEDFDQARSQERTNTLQDWLVSILMARLPSATEGIIRMINTVLTPDCLTNRILKKSPNLQADADFDDWHTYFYTALDKENKSIWEEKHPTHFLLKERELRPRSFARNYMNCPMDDGTSRIKYEMLRFYDFVDINNFEKIYMHADTTHTAKTTSDYFCLVVLGENKKDKNYYILDFILDKADVEKQARTSIVMYQQYKSLVKKFTYDEKANNGFGFWIKKLAKEEYNVSLPIEELKFAKDKVLHFEPHEPHFIANRVYFPSKHKQLKEAINQLLNFPDGAINDDFVDGLSGVLDNFIGQDKPLVQIPHYDFTDDFKISY